MAQISIVQALNQAIMEEMERDERVFCLGEDISDADGGYGGAFAVTRGLHDKFGYDRVLNTPISEILIAGMAVGAAMTGMRPIADLQYGDFLFCCMDHMVNQAAKCATCRAAGSTFNGHARTGGRYRPRAQHA
jgi:pyruvate dehydrogenase E1 component beta subunit